MLAWTTYLDQLKYIVKVTADMEFNNSDNDTQLLEQVLQYRCKYVL